MCKIVPYQIYQSKIELLEDIIDELDVLIDRNVCDNSTLHYLRYKFYSKKQYYWIKQRKLTL